ncbi:MAG: galactokinase [Lachnospiraceae bacterium]|nr:galactokinase [Lachnospiraceae bacterium]
MAFSEQAQKAYLGFQQAFGDTEGVRVFFAPGRVNLIGEHTDYNGGHVFPCAISFGIYAAVRKRADRKLRFLSANFPQVGIAESSLDELVPSADGKWINYPMGVIWAFERAGEILHRPEVGSLKLNEGMDISIYGDIPSGAGLSSSAAMEVLIGTILRELYGFSMLSNQDLALIGQYSENEFNGMKCGIMDQFASAMGKEGCAIFLDTNTMVYEYAPIDMKGMKLMITNTKKKHQLVDSEYNLRRQQCAEAIRQLQTVCPDKKALGEFSIEEFEAVKNVITDPVVLKRAKHAVYENQRTIEAVAALKAGDLVRFGKLMNESHVSLRDDYETSCEEADILAEEAWKMPGVLGSRITGGGFGGCTVSIVREETVPEFIEKIGAIYLEKVGHDADFYELEISGGPRELVP